MQEDMAVAAGAYLAWWDMAGVDVATDEAPVNWLRPAAAGSSPPPIQPRPSANKPTTLDEFKTWLRESPDQPERRWSGTAIMPQGQAKSPLMVITDMPDPADMDAGSLLAERAGRLFDAMLAAIGFSRDNIYLTSLFSSRPPGGMVEAADLSIAADRMRTHVFLAQPDRMLIMGDRTIRAFLPVQDKGGMDNLHFFNHDGGIVPAFATFHPRLLLGQPAAKAECWRTLQRLVEEMHK
jgi:DNA polymerase